MITYVADSKVSGKLVVTAVQAEEACAVYREALKNVLRSPVKAGKKIANEALFGKATKQRGKEMLKIVKAGIQVAHFMRKGTQKDFEQALSNLEYAFSKWSMTGVTANQWVTQKKLYERE